MAQDDAERLLELMERPKTADASLPPGYVNMPLRHFTGMPVVEHRYVMRGKKVVDLNAAANRKLINDCASICIPVIDRKSPLAEELWLKSCQEVEAYQKSLASPSVNTPKAPGDAPSRPTLVRR